MEHLGRDLDEVPLWYKLASPSVQLPTLQGSHNADTVIVGGGVAGLSTGFHLALNGDKPVVLEANELAGDASAKSAGIITSMSYKYSPGDFLKRYDTERARKYMSLFGNSGRYLFSFINKFRIQCDSQPFGFLAPASSSEDLARLSNMADEWQAAGYDFQYVGERRVRYLTGLPMYGGALLDPTGGAVNPLAFAREIARAAIEAGANIFVKSRVTQLTNNGALWCLHTDKGTITAKNVVLCSGGGNRYLHKSLSEAILPLRVVELATEPLQREIRNVILPENHSLTDVNKDIFTIRYDRDGRLITAWPAFLARNTSKRIVGATIKRMSKISPYLKSIKIEHIWKGTAWLDPALLPRIYRISAGLYAISACNGRGLAINTILGREMADFLSETSSSDLHLLIEKPEPIKAFRFMYYLPGILTNVARCRAFVNSKTS